MSEMIERVARHLWDVFNDMPSARPVVPLMMTPPENVAVFRKLARAMIEAMRELGEDPGPRYTAGEYSRRSLNAMIDDALE